MQKAARVVVTGFLVSLAGCDTAGHAAADATEVASQTQNMWIGAPCESDSDCNIGACQHCTQSGCQEYCYVGLERCIYSGSDYGTCDNVTDAVCRWVWFGWASGPYWFLVCS